MFHLHTNHQSMQTAPLACPTKKHAAWLARMLVRADADMAAAEHGEELTAIHLSQMHAIETNLVKIPLYCRVQAGWGGYTEFWITEADADDRPPEARPANHNPYNVIAAFQHFSGQPLYTLDAVQRAVTKEQLADLEETLERIAVELDNEDVVKMPKCGLLAEKIRFALGLSK